MKRRLGDASRERRLVDPSTGQTGQTFVFRDASSLMFVRVCFWTHIFVAVAAVAVVLALAGFVPPAP
jgi:hypothetical protein